jgi:3-hydroxybutyryl-CoA dehydrogenase
MQVVILCNNRSKEELLDQKKGEGDITWIESRKDFLQYPGATACIDLLFENARDELELLIKLLPCPVVVHSVQETLEQIHPSFVRINGWPGFLKGQVVEASCTDPAKKQETEKIFSMLGKSVEWLPDKPGFITPRVISMIINEAFFALQDGVSTREEIDTAMKLGTNYPFGPFEWAQEIGLHRIAALLQKLSEEQKRYTPCPLLLQQVSPQSTAHPTW